LSAYFIKRSLPLTEQARSKYIYAWEALLSEQISDTSQNTASDRRTLQRALFEHVYNNLNVLDGKANSLISLSSMLTATFGVITSIMFSLHPREQLPNLEQWSLIAGGAYAIFSSLFCVMVIPLYWSSAEELSNTTVHLHALIKIRTTRTVYYRRARALATMSLLFLIMLLLALAGFLRPQLELYSFPAAWALETTVFLQLFSITAYDWLVQLWRRDLECLQNADSR
jgi:hypothetical protein